MLFILISILKVVDFMVIILVILCSEGMLFSVFCICMVMVGVVRKFVFEVEFIVLFFSGRSCSVLLLLWWI